jgi:hypothetical protein
MNTALNATAPTFQPKEPAMTKLRIVLALLVALVLPAAAEAVSGGCLPDPFPTTPIPPVVAENVSWGFGSPSDKVRFEIWRQLCLDGSGVALLLRASPLSPIPGYFCDNNLAVLQGGHQFDTVQAKDLQNPTGYCNGIYIPKTFLVEVEPSGGVLFDELRAFTLVGVDSPQSFQIAVPAAGTTPPPPSLTVQATGCTTCHPGDTVGFQVEIINAGPPILVELKTGARLPDGSLVPIQDEEGVLPTGVSVIPVFTGFVLPAAVPPGIYAIEAEILDATLGVTISEDSAALIVAP